MNDTLDFKQISVDELQQWIDQGKEFILIDTLTNEHFDKVHLPGAVNACVFEVVFPARVEAIAVAKDQPIVVYGFNHATHDASTAAEKLQRLGYLDITVLLGGIMAWRGGRFSS